MKKNIDIKGNADDVCFSDYESITTVNNGLSIHNYGVGNKIYIGENVVFNNFNIRIDCNNSEVIIGEGCRVTGTVIMKISDNNILIIGEKTSIGGANFICAEGKSIIVGKDCMIAWGIEFRNTDSHAIFDLDSRQRINDAKDIFIGDHVWIGAHSTILKGTKLKDGSVVAIKSLVSSAFEVGNVVVGGIPAKILKNNIYWERPLLG